MVYAEHITARLATIIDAIKRDIANSKRRGDYAKRRDDWHKFHTERSLQDSMYSRLDVAESPIYLHWVALRTAYLECIRGDGMAVWQDMAQFLGITHRELDYAYSELLHNGFCSIEHHEFAYLAYGVGYRDRKEYQLVSLRFVDPLTQA